MKETMSNFLVEKKKLFALLAIIAIVIAIVFTVIIARQQQQIKQRASGKISLYFVNKEANDCSITNKLTSIPLT